MSRIRIIFALFFTIYLAACDNTRKRGDSSPFDKFDTDLPIAFASSSVAPTPPTLLTAQKDVSGLTLGPCGLTRVNCVVDGDTLWLYGTKVRVADIDTPEISKPRCAAEKALGDQATDRFIQLLNQGPFQVVQIGHRTTDKYGRELRVIVRDGRSIGNQLVAEGLARTWTGRREPWC